MKVYDYTTKKLREIVLMVLNELKIKYPNIKEQYITELHKKLKQYKYIDEMDNLKPGTHIRWISLEDKNKIKLTNGAKFCKLNFTDDGVNLVYQNYGYSPKYYQILLDDCLVFQKLTSEELVLLSALDHLSK